MQNKALLLSTLLIVSNAAMAEQSLLEGVAKETVKNTATSMAPGAVEGAQQTGQTLKDAKQMKDTAQKAPEAAESQAKEALKKSTKQQLEKATPAEVKEGEKALKSGAETARQLKGQVPESSTKHVKSMKHKATAKAKKKTADETRKLLP